MLQHPTVLFPVVKLEPFAAVGGDVMCRLGPHPDAGGCSPRAGLYAAAGRMRDVHLPGLYSRFCRPRVEKGEAGHALALPWLRPCC